MSVNGSKTKSSLSGIILRKYCDYTIDITPLKEKSLTIIIKRRNLERVKENKTTQTCFLKKFLFYLKYLYVCHVILADLLTVYSFVSNGKKYIHINITSHWMGGRVVFHPLKYFQ